MKKLKFSKDEGTKFYKELTEQVDQYFDEKGIQPNQTTYWGGIVSHLRLLKKMGVESK